MQRKQGEKEKENETTGRFLKYSLQDNTICCEKNYTLTRQPELTRTPMHTHLIVNVDE